MASGNVKKRESIRHVYPLEPIAFEAPKSQEQPMLLSLEERLANKPSAVASMGFSEYPEEWDYLQEELEQDWESREKSRYKKRDMFRNKKTRVVLATNDFYRLLKKALKSETLQSEKKFDRLLMRTRSLTGFFNKRPDLLRYLAEDVAETIFERQQEFDCGGKKTGARFSMLASNFLALLPEARHYLNRLAEKQSAYENDLLSAYYTLKTALTSKAFSNEQLAAVLNMPVYTYSTNKVPGLNKRSIRETTTNIAELLHGISSNDGGYHEGTQHAISELVLHLKYAVYGLREHLDKLNNSKPESNG